MSEEAATGGAEARETPSGEAIVVATGLTRTYRRGAVEIQPLRGLDLTVARGEFVVLMGPSGSGKTTLLNLVAGIDKPTSGRIVVAGQDISLLDDAALARWRTRTIGYIFQFYNLVPVLTAYENVELPLLLLPLSRQRRRLQVEAALEAAGIADRADHYPRQLSGGQEQRVAIARAIVTDPEIVIADEPTGDLDAESEGEIMALLSGLNREFQKTFVMVTHDPSAAAYGQRLVRLEKGILAAAEVAAEAACPLCGAQRSAPGAAAVEP